MSQPYKSGRQQNLNLGISSVTENRTVLQTIGKVGIGTTNAQNHSLFVVGSTNITGDVYVGGASTFVGVGTFGNDLYVNNQLYVNGVNVSGGATIGQDITTRHIYASGVSTFVGVSTFGNDVYINSDLYVKDDLTVDEINARNAYVSGITTLNITSATSVNASGIITANSFRPSSGFIQAADGTNSFYIYSGSGNVAFQGTIGASSINNGQGYQAINFTTSSTPTVLIPNDLNVTGLTTLASAGGITTTGGDLYVGNDLYVKDDITADELNVRNIRATGVSTLTSLDVLTNFDVYDTTATFHSNVRIDGNLSIGGTSTVILAQDLKVLDKEITLGITTDAFGNDISNDVTANHGGISIASTVGYPLVDLSLTGFSTIPATYKQLMWVAANSYGVGTTDAWMFNYAVGIGSTLVPNGVRLAVGGIQLTDTQINARRADIQYIDAQQLRVAGVSTFTNGPVLIGSGTSTGTLNQKLQVTGGGYISSYVGIGFTDPFSNLAIYDSNGAWISLVDPGQSSSAFENNNGTLYIRAEQGSGNSEIIFQTGTSNYEQKPSVSGSNRVKINNQGVLLVNMETSSGVAQQNLQVTGGAYVSGNTGIGLSNATSRLHVQGDELVTGVVTATRFYGEFVGTGLSVTGISTIGILSASNLTVSGIVTVGSLYVDATQVLSNDRRLRNITSIQASGITTLGITTLSQLYVAGISTFDGLIDANAGATINNIRIGVANDNTIDTITGGLTLDSNSGTVTVDDNLAVSGSNTLSFNSSSLNISHSGGNANIFNGLGDLILGADGNRSIRLERVGVATLARFTHNGSAELYYSGSKKLETIGSGVTITGTTFTNQLSVSGVSTFSGDSNFNQNINVTGVATIATIQNTTANITNLNATRLVVSGVSTFQDHIHLGDGDTAYFGTDDDMRIFHDGGAAYIDNDTGILYYRSGQHFFENAAGTETFARFVGDGSVSLYYDNAKKFETLGTGVTVTGTVYAQNFSTGDSGIGINISNNSITGPSSIVIDPAGVGDNSGAVRIKGDLYVDGTQFVVNSTTVDLADFRVGIATTVGTNLLLDGAGIGIGSANIVKTFTYNNAANTLESSIGLGVTLGGDFKTGTDSVLNRTTLGPTVVNSSLTSVGTLTNLNVAGVVTATTFNGQVNAGVGTITTLNGTNVTYTTGNFGTANVVTGVVTTISGSNLTYTTGNLTTGNIVTGVVTTISGTDLFYTNGNFTNLTATNGFVNTGIITNLTSTRATLTNINSSGITTLGIVTATQLYVAGITTTVRLNVGVGGTVINTTDSGRVGINSANPARLLDVNGDINFNGLLFQNGQEFIASNWVKTSAGIHTFSNVGIGTTNPAYDLDILGDLRVRGGIYDNINNSAGLINQVVVADGSGGWSWQPVTAAGAGTLDGIEVRDNGSVVGTSGSITTLDFQSTPTSNIVVTGFAGGNIATITLSETPTFGTVTASNASLGFATATTLLVSGVSTFQNDVKLVDNADLYFGDGNDLRIFHNGSNSFISEVGTGSLFIDASSTFYRSASHTFRNGASTETLAIFTENGSVELYYDNSKKFETSGLGVTVYGAINATSATFSGNVSIGGTLTYEDVTNVDAIGVITARSDVRVGGNLSVVGVTTLASAGGITTTGGDLYVGDDLFFKGNLYQNGALFTAGIGIGSTATNPQSGNITTAARIGVGFTDINFVGSGLSITGYGSTVVIDLGTLGGTTVSISSVSPGVSTAAGNLWWDSINGDLKIYYVDDNSSQWIDANGGSQSLAIISDVSPAGYGVTSSGTLWWDSSYGVLKVYYDDGDSEQWVDANSGAYINFWVGNSAGIHTTGKVGIGTTTPTEQLQVNGQLSIDGNVSYGTTTFTTSSTSLVGIHSALATSTYRSVEYTIQATEGTNFHTTKILALHNGTTAYHTEYGSIFNNVGVSTYDVDVSGGNIRLLATPTSASTTNFKVTFNGIKV